MVGTICVCCSVRARCRRVAEWTRQ